MIDHDSQVTDVPVRLALSDHRHQVLSDHLFVRQLGESEQCGLYVVLGAFVLKNENPLRGDLVVHTLLDRLSQARERSRVNGRRESGGRFQDPALLAGFHGGLFDPGG